MALADQPQRAYGMMVVARSDNWHEVRGPRTRTLADAIIQPVGLQKQRRRMNRETMENKFSALAEDDSLEACCENFQVSLPGAAADIVEYHNNVASPHIDNTIYTISFEIKPELAVVPDMPPPPLCDIEHQPRGRFARGKQKAATCRSACCGPTSGCCDFPPLASAPIVNGGIRQLMRRTKSG